MSAKDAAHFIGDPRLRRLRPVNSKSGGGTLRRGGAPTGRLNARENADLRVIADVLCNRRDPAPGVRQQLPETRNVGGPDSLVVPGEYLEAVLVRH